MTELVGPGTAEAAIADCMSADGSCEVSNDAGDFVSCSCADGTGVAGGGTNDWAGLSELELQPICEEQLAMLCGPVPPPAGIECVSPAGACVIDNVPEDSLSCECADGSGGGLAGGNMWAGLSDMELLDQCNMELASLCGGAPPPPPPPPPSLECSSRLGACTIASEPEDFLECMCADGTGFSGGGGSDWAGLSDEELLALCEDSLAAGCAVGSETGGETGSETGEPGETGGEGSTGGAGSTGEPGQDTGVDDSGGVSEGSSGSIPDPTAGDDATGGASEGSDGGAGGDEGGSSGGCSVAPRSTPAGWALVLLGLVGAGWRRRRPA